MSESKPTSAQYTGEVELPRVQVALTLNTPPAASSDRPPVVESQGKVTVGERTLAYQAKAGHFTVRTDDGKPWAEFFFTAYTLDGAGEPQNRPLLFAFNGGPGSSSVWLHMGAWGPRRVVLGPEGEALPPPARLADNPGTLLDVADLVFIDPVGTGLSKAAEGVDADQFWNVEGDVDSVAAFITQYLTANGRWASPIYLGGESYGTMRSAGLAQKLQGDHGLYLAGIVLVSSVLSMATIRFADGNDLPYVLYLPAYAATAWYHNALKPAQQKLALRDLLAEAEEFALGDYASGLLLGDRLPASRARSLRDRLSRLTGLSTSYLEAARLRIDMGRFNKELLRDRGQTVGRLDSRYLGRDRALVSDSYEYDPSSAALSGAYTSAWNHYLGSELGFRAEQRYQILAPLYEKWGYGKWGNRYLNFSDCLREAMTHNPSLRVLCANGYYDLAAPYFATEHTFAHLGLHESLRDHLQMTYYEAGHMMYVKDECLHQLGADVRAFVAAGAGTLS